MQILQSRKELGQPSRERLLAAAGTGHGLVDQTWADSNQILPWLRQLEGLRPGGIEKWV